MALSREFLKKQFRKLETNYGKDRFKITQEMFDLWMEMFSECTEAGIKASVDEYILQNEYPPTIAGIMKIYNAKAKMRKEAMDYVAGNYSYISHWCNETPNNETYAIFKRICLTVPLKEVTPTTDRLMEKLMRYYKDLDCIEQGKPLKELLKEME